MHTANLLSTYRSFSFMALLTSLCLLLALPGNSMGLLTAVTIPRAAIWMDNEYAGTHQAETRRSDMTKGYWTSHQTRDKYCVRFHENNESSNWGMTECFDKTAFEKKQTNVFLLKRETGTLTLTGVLDQPEGEGEYEFAEDGAFRKYLTDNNITSRDQNLMFHLYLADVNKAYIEFLKSQYTQVNGDRLLELAIHGVTQKSYQTYLTLFEKYSGKKPGMQEVIEAKIHGLDQTYVEELRSSGFTDLSMRKMMETKIHGVDAAYITDLKKEGFPNLSMDQILSARIHGINSSYIGQVRKLGFTNLSLDKMMEAKIHGVNTAYIQDLEKAGFTNLPIDKLIEAKIHGVNADFIEEAKDKGYKLETIGDYVSLKIHGMTRNAIRD